MVEDQCLFFVRISTSRCTSSSRQYMINTQILKQLFSFQHTGKRKIGLLSTMIVLLYITITVVSPLKPTTCPLRWLPTPKFAIMSSSIFQNKELTWRLIQREDTIMEYSFLWWLCIRNQKFQSFRYRCWNLSILSHILWWVLLWENSKKRGFWFWAQVRHATEVSAKKQASQWVKPLTKSWESKSKKQKTIISCCKWLKVGEACLTRSIFIQENSTWRLCLWIWVCVKVREKKT